MKKFRTIIIDDEPLALEQIESLLGVHDDSIEIVKKAVNGSEAIKFINELKPDLIFLDIQIPEYSGFEVIQELDHLPLIIFTTAYDKYALEAFETNTIDYLLKPIDPGRLSKAIKKLHRFSNGDENKLKDQLRQIITDLQKPERKSIKVQVGNRIILLDINKVYFFKALERYVEVNTFDAKYLISETLRDLEITLPGDNFKRIHRSAIININYMKEIIRKDITTYKIIMIDKNRTMLPLSLTAKSKLLK